MENTEFPLISFMLGFAIGIWSLLKLAQACILC